MTFSETGLSPEILQAITDLGYTQPTPIQEKTIPVILSKAHDLVALAQTGTGKTAAFGLPILGQIDMQSNAIQALVLAPTRELCMQISKDLEGFGKYVKGMKIAAVYGGASIDTQIRQLRRGPHIVVGTPGRTLDLIRRGELQIGSVRWLVLDEADEMLKMGFQEDMDAILASTPATRQTLLFSATMPSEIVGMTRRYMKNPEEISVAKNTGAANVEHWYYVANPRERYLVLKRIADLHPEIYGIIFCRTRIETQEIASMLIADNYNADALHGDLSQSQRDHVMGRFRNGNLQLLVATDVAARGLDVDDLTHIINFRLPDQLDSYIHRSGRTGRAGKHGISISLVGPRDRRYIRILEGQVGKPFIEKRIPSGQEILQQQLLNYIGRYEQTEVDADRMAPFMTPIYEKLSYLSREDLVQKFVAMEFNRLLNYYKTAGDLHAGMGNERDSYRDRERGDRNDRGDREHSRDRESFRDRERPRGERTERTERPQPRTERTERPQERVREEGERESFRDREPRRDSQSYTRFFINLGTKNHLNPPKLISLINAQSVLREVPIGKIEILKKFSFFEVDSRFSADIAPALSGQAFEEVTVHVEQAEPPKAPAIAKEKAFGFKNNKKKERTPDGFWKKTAPVGAGARGGAGRPSTGSGFGKAKKPKKTFGGWD